MEPTLFEPTGGDQKPSGLPRVDEDLPQAGAASPVFLRSLSDEIH